MQGKPRRYLRPDTSTFSEELGLTALVLWGNSKTWVHSSTVAKRRTDYASDAESTEMSTVSPRKKWRLPEMIVAVDPARKTSLPEWLVYTIQLQVRLFVCLHRQPSLWKGKLLTCQRHTIIHVRRDACFTSRDVFESRLPNLLEPLLWVQP
jgi:hypothetical protein